MNRRIALVAVLTATLPAILGPATAAAAGSVDVALVGTFTAPSGATGVVGGVLTIEGFADDGGLIALATASYSLCIPDVDPKNCLASLIQAVQVPVARVAATCAAVTVDLAAFTPASPPELTGYILDFDAIEVTLTADTAAAQRTACALARQLDHGARDRTLARLLNRLLGSLAA